MKTILLFLLVICTSQVSAQLSEDSIVYNVEHNLYYKIYDAFDDYVLTSGGAETICDAKSNFIRLKIPIAIFDKQFTQVLSSTKPSANLEIAEEFHKLYFDYIIIKVNVIKM